MSRLLTIHQYALRVADAPHGQRTAIVEEACRHLNVKPATFYRELRKIIPAQRQRRADAGQVELSRAEAEIISAYLMEGYRKNSKKMMSVEEAVLELRANGAIRAERLDESTGELKRLSIETIRKSLKAYVLHPEQLRKPTPHTKLKSKHPNHVFQVDSSVCVLVYLPGSGSAIVEMDEAEHYKNKPQNLKAIEQCRVIRYVLTDHCSGVIRARYYPHSENARHTVDFLAWAMAPKPDPARDPFNGACQILMCDLGISQHLVARFCRRLGITLMPHKRKNARATGSVEGAHNIWETNFEQGLRFNRAEVTDIDSLNALADMYQLWFNATKVHTRHGMTRFAAWMHIRPDELITTQPADVLLSLATDEPVTRDVKGDLTVRFKGRVWDVSMVPGVLIGGKVLVHWHPFIGNTAMAVTEDQDGREIHHQLRDVTGTVDPRNNEWGFSRDAAVIGEEYKARPDTLADTARKKAARIATGLDNQDAADKAREHKDYVPFNGAVDAFKVAREAQTPDYIGKRGTPMNVTAPTVELIPLTHVQAAKLLRGRLGDAWTADHLALIKRRYPAGVPEADIESLADEIRNGKGRPSLTVVK